MLMEEENVALRQQLAQVQQQLQAIRDPAPPVMTQPQVPRDLSLAEAFSHCMRVQQQRLSTTSIPVFPTLAGTLHLRVEVAHHKVLALRTASAIHLFLDV